MRYSPYYKNRVRVTGTVSSNCLVSFPNLIPPKNPDYHLDPERTMELWGTPMNATHFEFDAFHNEATFQTSKSYPSKIYEYLIKSGKATSVEWYYFSLEQNHWWYFHYYIKDGVPRKTIKEIPKAVMNTAFFSEDLLAYVFPDTVEIPKTVTAFFTAYHYSDALDMLQPYNLDYSSLIEHFNGYMFS